MIRLELLVERKKHLEKIIFYANKALKNAPEGAIRGVKHGKSWQYFWRKKGDRGNGIYLSKSNINQIKKLCNKRYCSLLLERATAELSCVNEMITLHKNGVFEDVFYLIPDAVKQQVVPVIEPDESFLKKWENIEYERKEFYEEGKLYKSDNNEKMRSKSEALIANMLIRNSIPYHYEKPLSLNGLGTVYPDFTLLDLKSRKEIFWEHMGMMDDAAYSERAIQKIQNYANNGIFAGDRLILTFESKKNPINIDNIEKMILKRLDILGNG